MQDLTDVLRLITVLKLPRNMADQLDPSVRAEYLRLWQTVQDAPRDEG
jgi:hypothetical protein